MLRLLLGRKRAYQPLDVLEVREILKRWIYSCESELQLKTCRCAVNRLVIDRYSWTTESPYVLVHVSSYLHSLIRMKESMLRQRSMV